MLFSNSTVSMKENILFEAKFSFVLTKETLQQT